MRKYNQTALGSGVYRRIREARMSASERERALDTLRTAEAIVDAIVWVKDKVVALGDFLLHPSLKH